MSHKIQVKLAKAGKSGLCDPESGAMIANDEHGRPAFKAVPDTGFVQARIASGELIAKAARKERAPKPKTVKVKFLDKAVLGGHEYAAGDEDSFDEDTVKTLFKEGLVGIVEGSEK